MRQKTRRTRRSLSAGERIAMRMFARGRCWICGRYRPDEPLENDHPYSHHDGGETVYPNSRVAHRDCNRKKGARTYIQQDT